MTTVSGFKPQNIGHNVKFNGTNWPESIDELGDLKNLTNKVTSGTRNIHDSLRAMFLLTGTEKGLLQDLFFKSQCCGNGSEEYQNRVARNDILPAAKAFIEFFTAIVNKIESSKS